VNARVDKQEELDVLIYHLIVILDTCWITHEAQILIENNKAYYERVTEVAREEMFSLYVHVF